MVWGCASCVYVVCVCGLCMWFEGCAGRVGVDRVDVCSGVSGCIGLVFVLCIVMCVEMKYR